jgi:hypothetical protein
MTKQLGRLYGNTAPLLFTVQISARDYDTLQVALGAWNSNHKATPLQLREASIHSGEYLSSCYFGEFDTVSGLQQRLKRQVEPQIAGAALQSQLGPGQTANEAANAPATETQRGIDVGTFEEDDYIVGDESEAAPIEVATPIVASETSAPGPVVPSDAFGC